MITSPGFRGTMVIMALVAMSGATYVAISLAAPTPKVATASGTKVIERADDESDAPPASEELIAAALKAGENTYKESLLPRAFINYGDLRVEPHFRNPIEMSSAIGRARRVAIASPVQASSASQPHWENRLVPGTNVRIWIIGTQRDLDLYELMVKNVWGVFNNFFPYPTPDDGTKDSDINVDDAIDFYFVRPDTIDPRLPACQGNSVDLELCTLGADAGVTREAPPALGNTSSGFVLINIDYPPNVIYDTIAHELAHVAQCQYALDEMKPMWFKESTATWVAYKVMKQLGEIPSVAYEWLKDTGSSPLFAQRARPPLSEFFETLHMSLVAPWTQYGSWLFFYYLSMEKGDGIVRSIWQKAAQTPGADGIKAIKEVIPLDYHFPRFTVRNWNQDSVPNQYKTQDNTFRPGMKPGSTREIDESGPYIKELHGGTPALAADYYHFKFQAATRKVTFNKLPTESNAHVWAIKKIGNDWKEPEDWTGEEYKDFCRDWQDEDLTNLVIIVSNSDLTAKLQRQSKVRIIADAVGCQYVKGWAKATLHVKDDIQDVRYTSSRVNLSFRPRDPAYQDMEGNTQYDLMPALVTWTAAGTVHDCTISGQILVTIPSFLNQPVDPSRPAYGYFNVVGMFTGGGDYHSIEVSAVNPEAAFTKTCPGDPPTVTKHFFPGTFLLNIPWQANSYDGDKIVYKGNKQYDQGKLQDFMKLLPPGTQLPQSALDALSRTSSATGSSLYTWEWELRPMTSPQTGGP